MLSSIRMKNINCEQEAKFIQDRILTVEKNISELCSVFSGYSRKVARIRDKGDELSKVIVAYAETEDINKSLSNGLINFATQISSISDYGDVRTQNIDQKVVNEFSQYENICKHAKDEVKQIYAARTKEISRKRQLDRAKERNPRNRQQIVQAESELVKASAEVSKTINNLEEQITSFEKQKLHDLKVILLDFVATEIGYHAKCLELLTKAYKAVDRIDEESDLQDFQKIREKFEMEFKKSLRLPESSSNTQGKRSLFRASQSLGSLSSIFSTPKKKFPGVPTTTKNSGMRDKRMSKSEEILDSSKDEDDESYSEASKSDYSDESDTSKGDVDDNVSPFIAKKYLK
ncbi:CBY1-interacting BAR domain-containing protein 1 isoform X1 [Onthophagus taurus]|uniref:CBY1-interacting BAR domain-containing protein 1 isoform X1 n=1 Tax=Onthophagus taurus TaxID=166361 RepID=UPI0039BE2375